MKKLFYQLTVACFAVTLSFSASARQQAESCMERCTKEGVGNKSCEEICDNDSPHSEKYCDDHPWDSSCKEGDHSEDYCDSHPWDSHCK